MFQRIRAALAAFDAGRIGSEHELALRLAFIEHGFTGRPFPPIGKEGNDG